MDTILNKAIRILLVTLICVMLIIGAIFIVPPSYAISSDDFTILYKQNSLSYSEYQEGYSIFKLSNNYYYAIKTRTDLSATPYYVFMYGSGVGTNVTSTKYVFLFKYDDYDSFSTYDIDVQYPGGSNGFGAKTYFLRDFDTILDGEYCYKEVTFPSYSGTISEIYCPYYSTLQEGLDAFINEKAPAWSGPATVKVEAGCVAYIAVDGGSAEFRCTFPELSNLVRPLWTSGATYLFENNLPSSGTYFTSMSGTKIDWLIPASADKNMLGQSHVGGRQITDLSSGQFLVVYNPFYRGFDKNGVGILSPTITVYLTNYGGVQQYKLTAKVENGDVISISDDGYTSFYQSIGPDELGSDGEPIYTEYSANGTTKPAITVGTGNNLIPQNEDTSIGGFIQRILDILSTPITYIRQIYNAAVAFFSSLALFWTWLPEPVFNIIVDALIVLIVIGVIKWLWK